MTSSNPDMPSSSSSRSSSSSQGLPHPAYSSPPLIPTELRSALTPLVSELVADVVKEAAHSRNIPSLLKRVARESDRILTPVSFCVLTICIAGVSIILAVLCVHEYDLGHDYSWLIDDASKFGGFIVGVYSALFLTAQRKQWSRTERNTNPAAKQSDS